MLLLTERQEELGMKGRPDVAQARATVADDEYNRVRQENLYTQAMLTLRTSMNLPADMPLEVDSVAPSVTPEPVMDDAEAVYSLAAATNPRRRHGRALEPLRPAHGQGPILPHHKPQRRHIHLLFQDNYRRIHRAVVRRPVPQQPWRICLGHHHNSLVLGHEPRGIGAPRLGIAPQG